MEREKWPAWSLIFSRSSLTHGLMMAVLFPLCFTSLFCHCCLRVCFTVSSLTELACGVELNHHPNFSDSTSLQYSIQASMKRMNRNQTRRCALLSKVCFESLIQKSLNRKFLMAVVLTWLEVYEKDRQQSCSSIDCFQFEDCQVNYCKAQWDLILWWSKRQKKLMDGSPSISLVRHVVASLVRSIEFLANYLVSSSTCAVFCVEKYSLEYHRNCRINRHFFSFISKKTLQLSIKDSLTNFVSIFSSALHPKLFLFRHKTNFVICIPIQYELKVAYLRICRETLHEICYARTNSESVMLTDHSRVRISNVCCIP